MSTWTTAVRMEHLDADLTIPSHPRGLVLFAHGSGSSRHSPRNRSVAADLHEAGLATVLADLLADGEGQDVAFNVGLLADRLIAMIDWLRDEPLSASLPLGLFGASTGAAAALVSAAARPGAVRAVVSRGGRPDLAGPALLEVGAPTLLIVGQRDYQVRELNEQARETMRTLAELRIIPDATHLFTEPGTLEQVAREACEWFTDHLTAAATGVPLAAHPSFEGSRHDLHQP